MATLVVGTERGVTVLADRSPADDLVHLTETGPRTRVSALVPVGDDWWAIAGERSILRSPSGSEWKEIATVAGSEARCLSPSAGGFLVGTSEAHLLRLHDGVLDPLESFDRANGRDEWYTPWGGPPDTRSISVDAGGDTFVNVHVGGVLRSRDQTGTWEPTMDIDMDVHQVLAHPSRAGLVYAASARGLGISEDGGSSWTFHTEGLHAPYCRAVAVCEDCVLVSASTGPRTREAAVYRRPTGGRGSFERCAAGLPQWFGTNIDTFCLAGRGETAACGTPEGDVYVSRDGGRSWSIAATDLPPVTCVAVA
jgi:hypothetical protein